MTTVVNSPAPSDSGNGTGAILAVAVILVLGFLFVLYALPMMRRASTTTAPQVSVPDKIQVDVNQPQSNQ
jgi:hypothetical protein